MAGVCPPPALPQRVRRSSFKAGLKGSREVSLEQLDGDREPGDELVPTQIPAAAALCMEGRPVQIDEPGAPRSAGGRLDRARQTGGDAEGKLLCGAPSGCRRVEESLEPFCQEFIQMGWLSHPSPLGEWWPPQRRGRTSRGGHTAGCPGRRKAPDRHRRCCRTG